jgi:hypothetical protein
MIRINGAEITTLAGVSEAKRSSAFYDLLI